MFAAVKGNENKKLMQTDRSQAILESFGLHELLVFVSLDGGKHVGNAGREEGGPGEIEFLDRSQNDSANDNGEAQPLGLGDLVSVDKLRKDGGKGGLGGL